MKSRLRNRHARRLASSLRWWLNHYSSCHECRYDAGGELSRVGQAASAIVEYREDPAALYPVRIPRRFWRELGRVVEPIAHDKTRQLDAYRNRDWRELGRVVEPGNSAAIAFWSDPTESAMVREEDG
jgi:hypothetical protein